jgi:acyl carrier protein
MEDLKNRLKEIIVETLNLEDVSVEDIKDAEPLIGGGLDLDSIDALELVVAIEKKFGIKITSSEESKRAFSSLSDLANYIKEKQ